MADEKKSRSKRTRLKRHAKRAVYKTGVIATDTKGALSDAAKSAKTAQIIADLEDRVAEFRRERKIGKDSLRATYVEPFRGYVTDGQAHVRVRVMEEPVIPAAAEAIDTRNVLRTNLRRFVALAFPGVQVRITMGEFSAKATTDRHGYAKVKLPAPDLEPGWYEYDAATIPVDKSENPATAVGDILVPEPGAVMIISDVDDTVLKTGLSEGMVAVGRTLFRDAQTRRPIPGMAALYQGLAHGVDGSHMPSFFYLSTGPWIMYDMLTDFFELNDFPDGVRFLTDWLPQQRYVLRSGREHKRKTLQKLFTGNPESTFVMIGDSGQKDPAAYLEIARQHPGQVKAIIIMDVGEHMAERADELRTESQSLRAEGIPFYFVENAIEAGQVLSDLGVLDIDMIGVRDDFVTG